MLIIIFLILITNPSLCVSGANLGLNLWFNSIVPTLLPFMIISNILIKVYSKKIKYPHIYAIFLGIFCGLPIEAIICGNLYENHYLTKAEAELLCGCFNLLSPAFIFCYAFKYSSNIIPLILAAYLPPVLIYISTMLRIKKYNNTIIKNIETACKIAQTGSKSSLFELLDDAIAKSALTIIKLGGYIIICCVFSTCTARLILNHPLINSVLTSLIEISSGINTIHNSITDIKLQNYITGITTTFTGLCCIMQTATILKNFKLSIKKYIHYKILTVLLSALSFYLAVYVF